MAGRRRWAALLALVVAVLLVGCSGRADSSADSAEDEAVGAPAPAAPLMPEEAQEAAGQDGGESAASQDQSQGGGDADQGLGGQSGSTEPLPPPVETNERLIRQGTIGFEVEAGGFDEAYTRVLSAAAEFGGQVVSSTTQTDEDDGGTFGSVTVRVPVQDFDNFLVNVSERIGTVRSRDITTQDVSAEYTDLQSRERTLEAQERFYLELFEQAQGVQDAISLRQQLDQVTSELEQVRGRINFLDDRTNFSTLTVELFEPGTRGILAETDIDDGRPSFARAWRTATDAFLSVVYGALVVGSFLLPLLLILGFLGVVFLLVRPLLPARAPRPPAPPANWPAPREEPPAPPREREMSS